MKKLKKGNIVTLMAESVNKLLKTDGPVLSNQNGPSGGVNFCYE